MTRVKILATRRNHTAVLIAYRKNRINHYLRFGRPQTIVRRNWQRAFAVFKPGQLFGYIRWRGNKYGMQDWRFYVAKTVDFGSISCVDGILPGAEILLETRRATRTKRVLSLIDELEKQHDFLEDISAAFWRHAHNAMSIGTTPHFISDLQKQSFGSHKSC